MVAVTTLHVNIFNGLKTMNRNTKDEIYFRPAWRSQWFRILLLLVGIGVYFKVDNEWVHLILPFFIGILLIKILIKRYKRRYMIGPMGVELLVGIFSRDFTRIEYRHIRGAHMRQSFRQRLLKIGQIEIATAGSDEHLLMDDVKNPVFYTNIIKNRLMNIYEPQVNA